MTLLRVLISVAALGLAGCGATPAPMLDPEGPLTQITVPTLPSWTDKYATKNEGDMRFFRISALMAQHGLTRLQAVEVQNQYRDLSRKDPEGDPEVRYQQALRRVQQGTIESRVDANVLAKAKFIVVFDLDDTLYDQYGKGRSEACSDFGVKYKKKGKAQTQWIKLNPGWKPVFERVRALGGAIVLFSANRDTPTWKNLKTWQWEGKPVASHPNIAGVLTNSYLTQTMKDEPPATAKRPAHAVVAPSKDLRQFDESLSKVIIVDDNPTRLFQSRNVRLYKKFHAKDVCGGDEAMANMGANQMAKVSAEIMDAAAYLEAHPKSTFVTAFLPYSQIGRTAVQGLMEGNDWSVEQAVTYIREHPKSVDRHY